MQRDGRIRFAGPDRVRIEKAAPVLAERVALVRDFLGRLCRHASPGPRSADDMVAHLLPPQVHVFVRDWLSANHVLLKSPAGHVLVDTGYVRHVPLTLALLASPRGLGAEPLAQVVNTHCHSDHMGGNAAVARAYGCGIAVPEGEVRRDRGLGRPGVAPRLRRPGCRALRSGRGASRPASATSGATSRGTRSPRPDTTWARCASTTRSTAS